MRVQFITITGSGVGGEIDITPSELVRQLNKAQEGNGWFSVEFAGDEVARVVNLANIAWVEVSEDPAARKASAVSRDEVEQIAAAAASQAVSAALGAAR